MKGWMSPSFGPVGYLGAVSFVVVIVGAVFGLLYVPWSLVLRNQ